MAVSGKFLLAAVLLCFCIAGSESGSLQAYDVYGDCELLTSPSGQITINEYMGSFTKCWRVRVPSNSFTEVNVQTFTSSNGGDCDYYYVQVLQRRPRSVQGDSSMKYCPGRSWSTFTAIENFTITLNVGYSSTIRLILNYRSVDITCARSDSFVCPDGSCVPPHRVCDEVKDCSDGSDEFGCMTGVFAAEGIPFGLASGVERLRGVGDLERATVALSLATDGNFTRSEEEREVVARRIEVAVLSALLIRNESVPVPQLSSFVHALLATCQDPRRFHGFDLVALLREQQRPLAAAPLAHLALCNARASPAPDATKTLNGILLISADDYPFILEIQAVAMMALSCLQEGSEELLAAISKMKRLQRKDGSFGNVYTTAIVTQALLSSGEERSKDWSVKSAVNHLLLHLNSTRADVMSTALILPVLNGKSLADVRRTNCSESATFRSGGVGPERLGPRMRIQYSLFVGDERDVVHTMSLRVPKNVTVFDVMQLAKEEDPKYDFKWKEMKSSKYVYEIAGRTNDFERNRFWFLFLGKGEADIEHLTKSPEQCLLQDGDHVVMWYKKAEISQTIQESTEAQETTPQ